ncbi:hypothetical protein CCHR01_08677 [Colletotrichum chrysophilum]|uniref:Uncharacterized protein n=1 Tax=Colletotrichum chrysophilum TaxID=1836956 RepID=A0AAD9AN46_9PEZI|nr:hypothetical protein CCHR01_08677 [Colletotrichum chrysophilum]
MKAKKGEQVWLKAQARLQHAPHQKPKPQGNQPVAIAAAAAAASSSAAAAAATAKAEQRAPPTGIADAEGACGLGSPLPGGDNLWLRPEDQWWLSLMSLHRPLPKKGVPSQLYPQAMGS